MTTEDDASRAIRMAIPGRPTVRLRPYQRRAVQSVQHHLADPESGHGVFVMPTGSGKTIVFAALIREWFERWGDAGIRVLILAHRYELLEQAEAKLLRVWPDAPVGVYSAGLGRREGDRRIVVAGIQSVHDKAHELGAFNAVIVDEAHLVPSTEDGMYRRLLADLQEIHPRMRVVGCTATPYRLAGGRIYGAGRLFSRRIFQAEIGDLIEGGYLCRLRSKAAEAVHGTRGVRKQAGDYVRSELERAVDTDELVAAAVEEMVRRARGRRSCLVFACGVEHAHHVRDELQVAGEDAAVVTGQTPREERADILERFAAGALRWVVNVECLTTGLDVERIDCIACLRPTQSTGLWVQMVGRGLRRHPDKADTLVLDFTANTLTHGPLDALRIHRKIGGGGGACFRTCPECREVCASGSSRCPSCGHEFPRRTRAARHAGSASDAPLFGFDAGPQEIRSVSVRKHRTRAGDDALRIGWRLRSTGEWVGEFVLLGRPGRAGVMAGQWWRDRFGYPIPRNVDEALGWFGGEKGIASRLLRSVAAVVVDPRRAFPVVDHLERAAVPSE